MTTLVITVPPGSTATAMEKLYICAQARGLKIVNTVIPNPQDPPLVENLHPDSGLSVIEYNPYENDAQALDLIRHFQLYVDGSHRADRWEVGSRTVEVVRGLTVNETVVEAISYARINGFI